MRVAIFGGSGFLGSHVADVLTEKGYDCVIYDIRESKYLNKSQKMIVGDILDETLVNKTVKGCDIIYNFAAISDIDECAVNPLGVAKFNVLGNSIILESARLAKVKRYLFASSSYVYSNYGSFYKSSKQACELFIHSYNEKYQLPYTILRYGSLYGDRADDRNSIYRILKEAIISGKIVYHGTGEEVREYIHIRDAAELSIKVLSAEFENKNVMLSGNHPMRYKDILDMINEMLGNKIEIIFSNRISETHYKLTNYNYKKPELGRRLINDQYIDFGVGLLECIEDISKEAGEKAVI